MDLIARVSVVQTGTKQALRHGGSKDKEQGTRPSSAAGQWSQPCTLLDEKLCMQYFMIVIAHLPAIRDTYTEYEESGICFKHHTGSELLGIPVWGIGVSLPVPVDDAP